MLPRLGFGFGEEIRRGERAVRGRVQVRSRKQGLVFLLIHAEGVAKVAAGAVVAAWRRPCHAELQEEETHIL